MSDPKCEEHPDRLAHYITENWFHGMPGRKICIDCMGEIMDHRQQRKVIEFRRNLDTVLPTPDEFMKDFPELNFEGVKT